tara:strand:- start:61 stop:549 length:489 start_codon:yes stop_codon:yes gene_type:complete
MGTRSLTIVKDTQGREVLNMYRQYDGYPTGHGEEVADFLKEYTVVDGLPLGVKKKMFNGVGCMAASIVKHFKENAGGIYLNPAGMRDCGEEYIYEVTVDSGRILLKVLAGCVTFFGLAGTKEDNMNIIFFGDVKNYNGEKVELVQKDSKTPPINDFLEERTE